MRPPHPTDYAAWVERLLIPHHHKEALWHLILSGPDALPFVRAGLAHDDPVVRVGCTRVLDHLVDEDAWPDLLEMLHDEHGEVRWHALHALACDRCKKNGCAPTKKSVLPAALDRLHNDPAAQVRSMAVEVVARWVHDDEEALAAVVTASESDADASVRKKATWFVPGGPRYEKTKPKVRSRAR